MTVSIRTFGLKSLLAATAVAIALTACGPGVPSGNMPVPAAAQQMGQAAPDGFDAGDAALGAAAGAAAGYMLGKAATPKAVPQTVIVQQPTTVYRTVPQPAYKRPWYSPAPKVTTTTTSRTYTSPSRSVTVSRRR